MNNERWNVPGCYYSKREKAANRKEAVIAFSSLGQALLKRVPSIVCLVKSEGEARVIAGKQRYHSGRCLFYFGHCFFIVIYWCSACSNFPRNNVIETTLAWGLLMSWLLTVKVNNKKILHNKKPSLFLCIAGIWKVNCMKSWLDYFIYTLALVFRWHKLASIFHFGPLRILSPLAAFLDPKFDYDKKKWNYSSMRHMVCSQQ